MPAVRVTALIVVAIIIAIVAVLFARVRPTGGLKPVGQLSSVVVLGSTAPTAVL